MPTNVLNLLRSSLGRILITAVSAIVIWGLMLLCIYSNMSLLLGFVTIVCFVFGWQVLPRGAVTVGFAFRFGWIAVFVFKIFLALVLGYFVAPFVIGKRVGEALRDSI